MKKVIGGRLYNTETAKCLGKWTNGEPYEDCNYCEEALYKTKAGAYFIYGIGGAASKYSVSCGNNSWSEGSHIEPMSYKAAMEWAAKHLTAYEYNAVFGKPEESGSGKERLLISISADCKQRLERMKEETGKSISKIIEEKFSSN